MQAGDWILSHPEAWIGVAAKWHLLWPRSAPSAQRLPLPLPQLLQLRGVRFQVYAPTSCGWTLPRVLRVALEVAWSNLNHSVNIRPNLSKSLNCSLSPSAVSLPRLEPGRRDVGESSESV